MEQPTTTAELIKEYIDQLSEIEKKVLLIAQEQLKSSFNIEKSIGFINWNAKRNPS